MLQKRFLAMAHPTDAIPAMPIQTMLDWLGGGIALVGAFLMASRTTYSGWAYPLYFVSSAMLLAFNLKARNLGQAFMQFGFLATNILGILRWL
jgi:hypothetical protein